MSELKSSRRGLLKGAAAAAAVGAMGFPTIVSAQSLGKGGRSAPSNRIVMGTIGTGGQGQAMMMAHTGHSDVQMVAVCDVDANHCNTAKAKVDGYYADKFNYVGKGCQTYGDFRELLARKDIDAVVCGTPDHWHGLVSIAAAQAGKDIYCEKPLVNVIAEGRAVCDAVKKYKRVLQCGSHERSNDNARYAAELVLNGRIGKLQTIEINLPTTDNHHKKAMEIKGIPNAEPVPKELDYPFWLGPAPEAPYSSLRLPFWWRFILAYGGGEMTDRGAHVIDLAQLGNGTDDTGPVELIAKGDRNAGSIYDTFWKYKFECKYANGVKMIGQSDGDRGLKFVGSEGWIFVEIHGCKLKASTESILKEKIKEDEIRLDRTTSHQRNFLDCVKSRGTPFASAEIGQRTATICHLLNIAMITGEHLKWDPVKEQITNSAKANAMLNRPMRKPWSLPSKG
ncbi:MAG: Gfo/Idh/MocA family oxidoreductase, partial [Phycisphaerae bacterium]|nr:Gfo/Idh/MocA family oxidoreductase [Phycisphaerae bacterium]